MKETPYEILKDDQKNQLGKNNEAKMILYNALPHKEYERVFMFYEMVLDNDGVASKTTKEKVKSLALKDKVTREQTSNDSDSQRESDEDIDEEEKAKALNLMARNFCKFFRKGNRFKRDNRFGNSANSNSEDSNEPQKDATCLMAIDSQDVQTNPSTSNNDLDINDLQKENEELLMFNQDFTKTFEKLLNEKRSLESEKSKLLSIINDIEIEVRKLTNNKEVVEPCKNCDVLTQEVDSLKFNISKLQDEGLNFSKFKKSSVVLDDMLSRQKLSQDTKVLRFSKNNTNHIRSQAPIRRVETRHQVYHSNSHNRLGYTQPQP
ncbi:hypothetical protein Tco_0526998 [Tanacetum coccineum]